MVRVSSLWRVCITLALALGLMAGAAQAQTTSASISGTVKDAQAAVLPGATVTLTSVGQGTSTTVTTDALGNFVFPFVKPDSYSIKVSLDGFQGVQRTIQVNANDRMGLPTFTLQVGQVAETITVVGQSEDIQLKSAERGFTLQNEAIQNIAVNGRSFFGLVGLVPGVAPQSESVTQVSGFSANGARTNSNNMTIDGVANIDTGDNGGNMAQTNLDAVAEFKVLTASYQAEYGRAVGAQVQVVTKSGTRNFSGSGYWYGRRSAWNENTWFNKRSNTAMAESSRNDMGFTVGGPVFIPGAFNKEKNKLFFFFSQEFQRRKDPVGESRVTVPTALERKGDFSQSVDRNNNPYPYIRDWQLAQANPSWGCSAADQRACFKYQGVLGRIDPSRLYGPSLAALSIYPEPNVSGQVGYNYKSQTPGTSPLDQTLIRADYQVNNNWRVTGRYMFHSNKSTLPYGIGGWSLGGNLDTLDVTSDVPGRNWMVSTTGILNSTTALEISIGSGHNSLSHTSSSTKLTRTGSGTDGIPMLFGKAGIQDDLIPRFDYGGDRISNGPQIRTNQAPFTNFNTTYDILANLTKVKGAHNLKAGFYYQSSLKPQSAFANFNGQIGFDNSTSNSYDSQHPFANAALGIYNSYTQSSVYAKPEWVYKNYEWYVQDNWKLNRLTLDYGLRFYYMTPQWDQSGQASTFIPSEFSASAAVRLYQPAMVNGVRVGYDAGTNTSVNAAYIGRIVPGTGNRFQGTHQAGVGIDKTLSDGNKFKVSPRIGATYDLTGKQKMVVRGSFGIFYDRPQGNIVFDMINNPPYMQAPNLQWGLLSDLAGATPLYAPSSLQPTDYNWKVPTVYQWNVGFQMQLPAGFTLDISHVGSEQRNLLEQHQINALPYGTNFLASSQDPTKGASAIPGANAKPADLLRPYQGYGGIRWWQFTGYADYKSLQTTVNRRFAKGLMTTFMYTYSKAKGTADSDWGGARIDGRDREANYGILSIDRPHNFVVSFVYQTPAVSKSKVVGYLANDWQVSGVYRYMTGAPYGVGFSVSGYGSGNLTGSDQGARIVKNGDPGSGNSGDPYKQIANTSVFGAPSVGSIGLESPRLFVYTPPTNNVDLSLQKSFPFGGKRRFEIRIDAFNALNTDQFTGINSTAYFDTPGSTKITNLPYDASGKLVNQNGFGSVSGQRSPRQVQIMTRFVF